MPKVNPAAAPVRKGSAYPAPFNVPCMGRVRKRLGLAGGAIGAAAALLVFLVGGLFFSGPGSEAAGALFGDFGLGPTTVLGIACVLLLIAGAVAVTSRLTVTRYLGRPD